MALAACGAALVVGATPKASEAARAGGKAANACTSAYKGAQQLEKSGQLRQARETVRGCVKAACGALRPKCMAFYAQLETDIPSVIPIVTDDKGAPRQDVQVTIDGEILTSLLDGRALPIDPGMHTFVFSTEAGVFATTKMMIAEGERNRPISVSMPSSSDKRAAKTTAVPKPATPTEGADDGAEKAEAVARKKPAKAPASEAAISEEPAPVVESSGGSVAPYLLGGVGLVGLGSYGMFTYWGRKDNEKLSQCSPSCKQQSLDHIRKLYLIADISLGVGLVALGAATWVALASGPSKEKKPSESAYVVDVHPTPNGAFASVSGSF